MDRKEFIKKTCQLGIGSGAVLLMDICNTCGAESATQSSQEDSDRRLKFAQNWIENLMNNMDAQLDESTRIKLMEACGRACAQRSINEAKACQGDLDKFLAKMKEWLGEENVRKKENVVFVVYSKCLCTLVQAGPPKLSDTYCLCSRGWIKEMFETVVGKSVDVDLTESIKQGGKACRLTIIL